MGRDTVQLETAVSTISQEYLLEFTSEYGISEALHPELPGPEDMIVDFPEGKVGVYTKLFEFANFRLPLSQFLFDILGYYHIHLSQLSVIGAAKGVPNYCGLAYKCFEGWDASREYVFPISGDDTEHTSYPNPETTRSTTLLGRVELQILPGRRDMDLFNLIRAPNPTKVKTGSRPHAAHEVPLLTVTANWVIKIEDPAAATDSSGVPSTIERSPLDFANENPSQQSTGPEDQEAAAPEVPPPEVPPPENVTTTGIAPEACPKERVAATGPPVVKERRKRGHNGVDTIAPPKVLRRDHADPRPTESTREGKSLAAIELGMGSTRPVPAPQGAPMDVSDPDPLSFADPQSRPSADVTQSSKGAAAAGDPESENTSFTSMVGSPESIYRPEWDITTGCLLDAPTGIFFREAKLLKKSVAQVARRDKRIQARENAIKNLETLLEAEADMKKIAKNNSAELSTKLENMRALFSDLQRYAKIDARLDALSIDFDEELYPHMLTAIAGRRLRLAVMKCGESTELRQAFADVVSAGIAKGMSKGLKHGVEHRNAKLDLEAIEAYDPEAEAKYIAALHALKNLKYPLVDQLESLKDAPIDVIMASLHLESDTGDDAPQWIRELPDAIAANVSRAEKKKKCRVVCRTHGVGSAHHARSDGVSVSVPTVAPQGLPILLADAATQTETSYEASPCLGQALYLLCMVESIHSTACEVTSFKIGNVPRPWKNCSVHGPQFRVHAALLAGPGLAVAPHRCLPRLLLRYDTHSNLCGYDRFSSIS
nr:transposase (putative), gypsy type [Tanacetum cinerariifolium]